MNHSKFCQVFIIFLFISGVCSFAIAGEWKRVGESCIRGCDEKESTPRVNSHTTEQSPVEKQITVTITPAETESESQPQWQIPAFKHERRSAKERHRDHSTSSSAPSGAINGRTGEYYPPVGGGFVDPKTGTFYPDVGGGYVNSRTGEFSPKIGGR